MFRVAPLFELKHLDEIFRHKVFNMLLSKGKITEELIDMLMTWCHTILEKGSNLRLRAPIKTGGK